MDGQQTARYDNSRKLSLSILYFHIKTGNKIWQKLNNIRYALSLHYCEL